MAYVAFISYKHSAQSRPHAEALEAALKRYSKPIWKPPIPVFRDERVLRPGDDLPAAIRAALRDSEYLIYLASREAAESEWVRQELEIWCQELGRGARLLIVHIADRITADAATGEVVWAETDALPQTLKPHVKSIPVWADISWSTTPEQRDLNNVEYRKVVNAITAVFRNKTPGDMNDEQVLTHRKNILFRNVGIAAVILFALVALVFGWQAQRDRAAAVRSAQAAIESERKAVANAERATKSEADAEDRRQQAEAASDQARKQQLIAQENERIAQLNALRSDLRGRAAQALAGLQNEPPDALRRSALAVVESARRIGEVPSDLQFSLSSGLLEARERYRAPIRVMPTSMALAPDGATLAIGSLDLVLLYNPKGVLLHAPLAGKDAAALHANAVAFSPDGKILVTAGGLRQDNCVLRIWSRDGRMVAGPWSGHRSPVRAVTFSPDSQTILSGAEDGSLRLWRLDGTLVWSNDSAYQGSINALAFAPDGSRIAGAGGAAPPPAPAVREGTIDNGIATWSVIDGSRQALRRTDATIFSLDVTDEAIVSGGADGAVRIWRWYQLEPEAVGRGHSGAIRALAVDRHTRLVATGGDDGRVGLWNLAGQPVTPLQAGHTGAVRGVGILRGTDTVVSVAEDATLRWWSLAGPGISRTGVSRTPDAVTLEAHEGYGVTATDGDVIRVLPSGTHEKAGRIEVPSGEIVQALAYSPTGTMAMLLSGAESTSRVVLRRSDGASREILRAGLMMVSVLLFSPDGRHLLVGGGFPGLEGLSQDEFGAAGQSVAISNAFWIFTAGGRLTAGPVRIGQSAPTAATFARNGQLLIVGDSAGDVNFFDPRGLIVRRPLRSTASTSSPLARGVTALAMSADNRMLAVAHAGLAGSLSPVELNLWDLGTGALVAKLAGHQERINALAFSPQGDMLASAGGDVSFVRGRSDYAIRLWSSPSGHALSPPWPGHEERVLGLTFIDGGRKLASLDANGALHHWRVGWREWVRAAEDRGADLRRAAEAHAFRLQSERHAAAGNYDLALDAIARAVAIRSDPDLQWSRAQILQRVGRLREALAAQSAAIELSRFDAVMIFERGKLRLRLQDTKGAIADFTFALELAPFVIRPAPVIADQLPWTQQTHDIVADLSRIAVADVRLHRAIARLQTADAAGAELDVNAAFALGLRSRDLYLTRAAIKRKRGDETGAREDERLAEQAATAKGG